MVKTFGDFFSKFLYVRILLEYPWGIAQSRLRIRCILVTPTSGFATRGRLITPLSPRGSPPRLDTGQSLWIIKSRKTYSRYMKKIPPADFFLLFRPTQYLDISKNQLKRTQAFTEAHIG
eukprot:SAG11_NODE_114_length_16040_cov_10.050875_2_plen_119_part_00